MALTTQARTLTIDLATIQGLDPAAVNVEIEMMEPRLLAVGGETLFPTQLAGATNAAGVATFRLLPSSLAGIGPYRIQVGGFSRVITMPDADARLSELPEA